MLLPELWLLTHRRQMVRSGVLVSLDNTLGRRYQKMTFKLTNQNPDQQFGLILSYSTATKRVLVGVTAKQQLRRLSDQNEPLGENIQT